MNHKLSCLGLCILAIALALSVCVTQAGGDGIVASANGSGQIHNPDLRTFTFTAQTDSSGISRGQEEVFSRSSGIRWHADINCLSVSGNVATMSGTVTDTNSTTPPFVVGADVLFQVVDNGHGQSGTPDDISLTFFQTTGPFPCTGFGTFATIPVEHGNVTVH
jgi:hypothetical protein